MPMDSGHEGDATLDARRMSKAQADVGLYGFAQRFEVMVGDATCTVQGAATEGARDDTLGQRSKIEDAVLLDLEAPHSITRACCLGLGAGRRVTLTGPDLHAPRETQTRDCWPLCDHVGHESDTRLDGVRSTEGPLYTRLGEHQLSTEQTEWRVHPRPRSPRERNVSMEHDRCWRR